MAYFSLSKDALPISGSEEFSSNYNGYTYLFSSAANKEAFEAGPDSYLPQWGGFCSYGVAVETRWTWESVKASGPLGNNKVWRVYDLGGGVKRLFFFMYALPLQLWEEGDVTSQIVAGNLVWENWTGGDFYSNTGCLWENVECGLTEDSCVYAQ